MIDIAPTLQYLASDPRYAWVALVVALVPVFHFLAREIAAIYRMIKPIRGTIEDMADAESRANSAMKEIAMDFSVDRAGLFLFHNGTKSLANIHFLKISMIAEGLSGRVGSVISQMQNRNLAELSDIGHRIIKNHETISIADIGKIKETHAGMYLLLHIQLVSSIYMMPIFNHKILNREGRPTVDGCIFVEHCGDCIDVDSATLDAIQARGQSVYNDLYLANNGK
jgi:hypothetical protein